MNPKYLVLVFSIGLSSFCSTTLNAVEWEGKASNWKGFPKFEFQVDGKACHVVVPKSPAAGKPWVWRARFPGYHPEADLLLLERGFHIAQMNTGGMFGSPRALDHWDEFYRFMTCRKGLAKKVVLEAVSRGGLFAYRWTARNPGKVACIYADVPVCDIKSWPRGSGKTWDSLLKQYGMTEEEAMEYRENPVDVLEPIARAGIPLLHLITLDDQVVPPAENTLLLAARYRKLGGSIELIKVEKGTAKSRGHHCTHPDPGRAADFMEKHAKTTLR